MEECEGQGGPAMAVVEWRVLSAVVVRRSCCRVLVLYMCECEPNSRLDLRGCAARRNKLASECLGKADCYGLDRAAFVVCRVWCVVLVEWVQRVFTVTNAVCSLSSASTRVDSLLGLYARLAAAPARRSARRRVATSVRPPLAPLLARSQARSLAGCASR